LKQITLTARDVEVHLGQNVVPLPNLVLQKNLKDAGSIRLGGEYRMSSWLTLRAGALYETSAIPEDRQALDWLHWQRFSLNGGVKLTWGKTDFSFAMSRFVQADRQVRDSLLHQLTAFKEVPPTVIGNGNYHSAITVAALAISTRL